MQYYDYETPVGVLRIAEEHGAVISIERMETKTQADGAKGIEQETTLLQRAAGQLAEYFAGKRTEFDFPIAPKGTQFQKQVWNALCTIPYGETRSYKQIAEQIGNAKACRAVGGANHNNPIMIVVPCHRVIGADRSLVGYGGGLPVKQYLLELEQCVKLKTVQDCGRNEDKMKPDGIILDVDGTLWDSTEIVAKAWNRAIAEAGIDDITVRAEELKKLFGKTMQVIAEELLPAQSEAKRNEVMELCCAYEHDALLANEKDITYPGVAETIRELSGQYKLCIVSNCQKGYIELFLDKTGLHPYITDIECYGNTGLQKGDNIRLTAERNQMSAAVYVGDTAGDYEASVQAGTEMIFAEYGFGQLPEQSRVYAAIHTFEELKDVL